MYNEFKLFDSAENKVFLLLQVVAINLFGLVVVGGDKAFHVLTVKQIEEQDNCSKQARAPGTKNFRGIQTKLSGEEPREHSTFSNHC